MQVSHISNDISLEQVVPYFQPIMDITNQRVWRYECLARFVDKEQQSFLPVELLYLVERRQSVSQLTQRIFNRSAQYFRHINVAWSINLSLQDMLDPELSLFLQTQMRHYSNPKRISLEITAKTALDNESFFCEFAAMCKSLKFGLTLDHFEPETCDLAQVLTLPIDALKISVRELIKARLDRHYYEKLNAFLVNARSTGITLIAEHIENTDDLELIKLLGFKYAQGFYLSVPQPSTSYPVV